MPKEVEVPPVELEKPKEVEVPPVELEKPKKKLVDSDNDSVSSKEKLTLALNKCLKDGQRVKHSIGDNTWIGTYDESKEGIVYNDKVYKKPSGFASDHVKAVKPDNAYTANGWTTCKCEVDGKWIVLKKHAVNMA